MNNPSPQRSVPAEPPRILLVDEDEHYRDNLATFLSTHGYQTVSTADVSEVGSQVATFKPHLVVLDQHLSATTGTEVLRYLRHWFNVPCIVVTSVPDELERVVNLEVGADDDVEKSVSSRELLARIRAVLRRAVAPAARPGVGDRRTSSRGWVLSEDLRELRRPDGSLCHLTTAEFDTLLLLNATAGTPVSRATISERVFGRPYHPADRAVDTVMSKLRQKLEPDMEPRLIKTLRGVGYIFTGFPQVE